MTLMLMTPISRPACCREMSPIRYGHAVKIDLDSKQGQDLAHSQKLDRSVANRVHDRLQVANGSYANKVLRSYAQDENGCLSSDQVRSLMDRLRTGLTEEEKDRWVCTKASRPPRRGSCL